MSAPAKGSTPGLQRTTSLDLSGSFAPVRSSTSTQGAAETSCSRRQSHSSASQAGQAAAQSRHHDETETENEKAPEPSPASPSALSKEEETYPEGDLKAWLVVVGSFSGMTACFGYMNTIGIFEAYLSNNQLVDYSQAQVGWIFSVYIFLSFFCGVQIGPVFDAKGPRWIVVAGTVALLLSVFLLGLCTQYWHFMIVFGVLGGIGTSLIFTPAVSAIGHWFLINRANATGIAAAGGSFGGVIFPLMLQQLLPSLGWAWATRILGFLFIFLLLVANFTIYTRLPPRPGGSVLPDFTIFRDRAFLLCTIGTYFLEWGLFIPITYISSYALSTGAISDAFSFQIVAIFNAASVFGRWLPGLVADKWGRYNTMLIAVALCMSSSLALWLPATVISAPGDGGQSNTILGLLVAYALIMGFASGSNISLTPVCVSMLCDTDQYGRYYATCYTIVSFGTLTGVPIAGAIIEACDGAYWGVATWTGLCYVFAFTCFGAVRVMKVGWKVKRFY